MIWVTFAYLQTYVAHISLHWLHVPERIIFKVATLTYRALHHLSWRHHSHLSPTCRTDAGSGPPPLNSLTFRLVVCQLSEVVPFLLLEQMACQAMLRRPRRCRCSRTGWRHTCSAAATKLFPFPSHCLPSRTVVLAIVFTVWGTFKMSMMMMICVCCCNFRAWSCQHIRLAAAQKLRNQITEPRIDTATFCHVWWIWSSPVSWWECLLW